tara:strand:+ start:12 stop:245 length:234 start_codon:yes stop_codon:yes gene_type:complete
MKKFAAILLILSCLLGLLSSLFAFISFLSWGWQDVMYAITDGGDIIWGLATLLPIFVYPSLFFSLFLLGISLFFEKK